MENKEFEEFRKQVTDWMIDKQNKIEYLESKIEMSRHTISCVDRTYDESRCEMEKQINSLTDMYKSVSIQCAANHEHKIKQIDENRKSFRRIEKIEGDLNYVPSFDYLNSTLIPRLEKLEKNIDNWEEEFYFLKDKIRSPETKPHKCPVCDRGIYLQPGSGGLGLSYCKSCDGKGIVWA